MKLGKTFWGLLFISIGLLFLINFIFRIESVSVNKFWPIFLFIPGLILELNYFITHRNSWTLVPGSILSIYGVLFFVMSYIGWRNVQYVWPVFILTVAVGLFQLYYFSGKPKKLLIPVRILLAVGTIAWAVIILCSFSQNLNLSIVIAVIFVAGGAYFLLKK